MIFMILVSLENVKEYSHMVAWLLYRRMYYASLDYYATFGKFEYNTTFLPLKSTFWAKIRLQRQFLGKKFEYNVT